MLVWEGVRWRPDDTKTIERLGKETVDHMLPAAIAIKDEAEQKSAIKAALKCRERRKSWT